MENFKPSGIELRSSTSSGPDADVFVFIYKNTQYSIHILHSIRWYKHSLNSLSCNYSQLTFKLILPLHKHVCPWLISCAWNEWEWAAIWCMGMERLDFHLGMANNVPGGLSPNAIGEIAHGARVCRSWRSIFMRSWESVKREWDFVDRRKAFYLLCNL